MSGAHPVLKQPRLKQPRFAVLSLDTPGYSVTIRVVNVQSHLYSSRLLLLQRAGYEVYGMQAPDLDPKVCRMVLSMLSKGITSHCVSDHST